MHKVTYFTKTRRVASIMTLMVAVLPMGCSSKSSDESVSTKSNFEPTKSSAQSSNTLPRREELNEALEKQNLEIKQTHNLQAASKEYAQKYAVLLNEPAANIDVVIFSQSSDDSLSLVGNRPRKLVDDIDQGSITDSESDPAQSARRIIDRKKMRRQIPAANRFEEGGIKLEPLGSTLAKAKASALRPYERTERFVNGVMERFAYDDPILPEVRHRALSHVIRRQISSDGTQETPNEWSVRLGASGIPELIKISDAYLSRMTAKKAFVLELRHAGKVTGYKIIMNEDWTLSYKSIPRKG